MAPNFLDKDGLIHFWAKIKEKFVLKELKTGSQDTYKVLSDNNCVYKSGYQLDYGADDTYNRVVAHFARQSKQDDPSKENYDPYPLSDSVYVDLPATHPYSYERLGRRKAYDLKVSDPCDHASLTAMAQRKLNEVSRSDPVLVIEHVSVPGLREGNLVQYINSTDPQMVPLYSVYAIIEEIQMELGRGCMCKTKLRCL